MSKNILLLPDTQIRPDNINQNLELMQAIGEVITSWKPDVVVDIGDHWDMYSLNTYDMSKQNRRTFDGAAVAADVEAGQQAMDVLLEPLRDLQDRQRSAKHKVYNPQMEFFIGNHEERIARFPELRELVTYATLFESCPEWTVNDFLVPKEIEGVLFAHYFANPLSGRPYGGSAEYRLNKVKQSFVQGHEQTFKYATEYLTNGHTIQALIAGACYLHNEPYKGPQGNNHFRGICLLHNTKDGAYDLEQVSVERLLK